MNQQIMQRVDRICSSLAQTKASSIRLVLGFALVSVLTACGSSGAREAELAAQEAARVAAEQEAARVAQEQERQRAMELQRQREAQEAERQRLAAERERREREAAQQAEQERLAAERAAREEAERQAALAAVQAQRDAKLARIAQLEADIAAADSRAQQDVAATSYLADAVEVSEELLDALAAEQVKYEDTDELGNPTVPLAKQQLQELEALKAELERQAAAVE